jgi:hypothetical protein
MRERTTIALHACATLLFLAACSTTGPTPAAAPLPAAQDTSATMNDPRAGLNLSRNPMALSLTQAEFHSIAGAVLPLTQIV